MARLEDLADSYGRHIATAWPRNVAGAQRVIMVVYDKELERTLRARKSEFEMRTRAAGHAWHEVDLTSAFADWLAGQRYRQSYFESPTKMGPKLQSEFPTFVATRLRDALLSPTVTDDSVVALFGVGSLYGFVHVSEILKLVEGDVKGRLLVFFPGSLEQNNYRLLDARNGWNYLAVPISLYGSGGTE